MSNRTCLIALLSLFIVGCGDGLTPDYGELGLVQVSGQVKFDGEPVPDVVVKFESPDQTFSFARTDSNGNYRLKFNSEANGVTPGEKIVRITSLGKTGEEEAGDPYAKRRGAKKELFPNSYNRRSTLVADVNPSNKVFNFDLKSDGK